MKLSDVEATLGKLPVVARRRVLYGEVDKMNRVYGSHYLTWFEHGRNEYLRLCGLPYTEIEAKGLVLPAFEAHVWYMSSASYDDEVEIRAAVTEATKVTALFLFSLECGGKRIAAGYTNHACLNGEGCPTRLPGWVTEKIVGRFGVGI